MDMSNKARQAKEVEDRIRKWLDLDTLDTRNRDSLDFHELSAASIRQIIGIAFDAGFRAASANQAARTIAAALGQPKDHPGTQRLADAIGGA